MRKKKKGEVLYFTYNFYYFLSMKDGQAVVFMKT